MTRRRARIAVQHSGSTRIEQEDVPVYEPGSHSRFTRPLEWSVAGSFEVDSVLGEQLAELVFVEYRYVGDLNGRHRSQGLTLMRLVLQVADNMARSASNGDIHDGEIRLWRDEDWWVATDLETGVTTQGPTRDAALENLDEAVAVHNDETGREPTDEELRELGIDPADNSTGEQERPDVLE